MDPKQIFHIPELQNYFFLVYGTVFSLKHTQNIIFITWPLVDHVVTGAINDDMSAARDSKNIEYCTCIIIIHHTV